MTRDEILALSDEELQITATELNGGKKIHFTIASVWELLEALSEKKLQIDIYISAGVFSISVWPLLHETPVVEEDIVYLYDCCRAIIEAYVLAMTQQKAGLYLGEKYWGFHDGTKYVSYGVPK